MAISPAEPAPVYGLTVEDAHEYFANGILVKNCDQLSYAALSLVEFSVDTLDDQPGIHDPVDEGEAYVEETGVLSVFESVF